MTTTPRWGLKYIASGQQQPERPHNEALATADFAMGAMVLDRDLSTPPGGVEGNSYIVATGGTGDWTDHDGEIATYIEGAWRFVTPPNGALIFVFDEKTLVTYDTGTLTYKTRTGQAIISLRDSAGGQAPGTAAAWNVMTWGTQDQYMGGVGDPYTHSTSTNPGEITLKEAGNYLVSVDIGMTAAAVGALTLVTARLTINGAVVTGSNSSHSMPVAGAASDVHLNINKVIPSVVANDILRVEIQKDVGGTGVTTKQHYSRITVTKIQ